MTMKKQASTPDVLDPLSAAGYPAGTPMAVALSGGADSVALLHLMRAYPGLIAVHVHHGIRADEADRDADFCRALCSKLQIPFYLLHIDAPAVAKQTNESLETAAREARYGVISALMREKGIPVLLTAHHADDQLETMLQHLLRGSGTRGLCGIPVCRPLGEGQVVVRPLLGVSKESLLSYLHGQGLTFVTDSTNDELCCQRNFLRLRVLPLLRELQPNAPLMAARCAEALTGDEQYLDSLAADFLAAEGNTPTRQALLSLPRPVLVRVLRRLLPEPPTARHVEAICALLSGTRQSARISLPQGTLLQLRRGRLLVAKREAPVTATVALLSAHSLDTAADLPNGLAVLGALSKAQEAALTARYAYHTTAHVAQAALVGALYVRTREAGDVILSGRMHKTVRRLGSLSHLAPTMRARMPLLCDEEGIVAVPFGPTRDGATKNADLTVYFYFN